MNIRSLQRSLAAVAATAVLAGCVTQDPYDLPPLDSPGTQHGPSTTLYYGYGPYARYGYNPYAPYGYGYSRYNYYPYYFGSGFYGPGYYSPGYYGPMYYGAQPYPPPGYAPYPGGPYCRDANRDGRCDARVNSPPKPVTPRPNTEPRRPPPPIKVAPPKASPPPAPRPTAEPVARPDRPAKRRSAGVETEEP